MNEHKPGTVPYCVKKWDPVTRGIDASALEVCSWVLEQEARYLHSVMDAGQPAVAHLKYCFPVIRRSVVTMAEVGPLEREINLGVVREFTEAACRAVSAAVGGSGDELYSELVADNFVENLAVRIHGSIQSFPG
jgi:hypothetical protein